MIITVEGRMKDPREYYPFPRKSQTIIFAFYPFSSPFDIYRRREENNHHSFAWHLGAFFTAHLGNPLVHV